MKKIIVLLILLSALLPVFAIDQSETEITDSTSITDTSFQILGYYKGALNNDLTFVIEDLSGNQLYQSYADATDSDHVNRTSHIFNWTMSGRTDNRTEVTIRFTFDTLQAELEGKFYRPQYALKMNLNQTKNSYGQTLNNDVFYNNNHTDNDQLVKLTENNTYTATKPANPSNSRYTETGYLEYSGMYRDRNGSTYWVRSGYCTLNISDYEDSVPGDYEYTCTVIVEITL